MKQRQMIKMMNSNGDYDLFSNPYSDSKNSDDEDIQLQKVRPVETYIEAQIQEGDTLQALALKFNCSIAELKRINHMHKENELFARRTLRVPVTPFSILTETYSSLAAEQPSTSTYNIQRDPLKSEEIELSFLGSVVDADNISIDCNSAILNSKLEPLPNLQKPYKDDITEEAPTDTTHLLNVNGPRESMETVVIKQFTSHGADFGIKWYHLFLCILVLAFAIPLIYVFYIAEKYDHTHPLEQHILPPDHPSFSAQPH